MEIKAWNKIKVNENEYMILDVLKYNQKDYIYCYMLHKENMDPHFFEYKILNDNLKVREENDVTVLKHLLKIVWEDTKKM